MPPIENHWHILDDLGAEPFPEVIVSPIDGAEMVLVPEGPFTMGISEEEFAHICLMDQKMNPIFATEVPSSQNYLMAYYIDRYPVTNYQYGKFIKATGHRKPLFWDVPMWNQPLQPVVFVGWDDARTYAKWSGKSIPTEAHWEKAGRGTDGRLWSWGHEFLAGRCNSKEYDLGYTSEIGMFHEGVSPNGCYDMCGNVWEMCEGAWIEDHLPMRGGCFLGSATFVRVTCRWTPEDPVNGAHWLGFRCVKEIFTPPRDHQLLS
jgi:formylglycine-generating enzyme required for sulfatase activity